jgi:hypothetical protein
MEFVGCRCSAKRYLLHVDRDGFKKTTSKNFRGTQNFPPTLEPVGRVGKSLSYSSWHDKSIIGYHIHDYRRCYETHAPGHKASRTECAITST